MAKYHINEKGVPGQCSAQYVCPFGGAAQHYASPEIAQKAFELSMASATVPEAQKKTAAAPAPAAKPAPKVERYRHPQGKLAEINPDGSVTAWKNGKIIPTSATADKLRAGHGSWKLTDETTGGPRPSSDASVLAKMKARVAAQQASVSSVAAIAAPEMQDELDRVNKLVSLKYPKTSGLDPRKTPKVEDREPERDDFSRRSYARGRAVLPTGDRLNPHDKPESNSFIQGWARGGDESVIAIVKQRGETRDTYRSILSGHNGTSDDIIGDSFPMEHDQTQAMIGRGDWVVVGVYEPKPGGAVMGEIPNQKIPFYVYK
jgi:hypothetical protein